MAQIWLAVLVLLAIVAVPNVSADTAAKVNNAGELWEALANPAVSTVTIDGARPHPLSSCSRHSDWISSASPVPTLTLSGATPQGGSASRRTPGLAQPSSDLAGM